MNPAQLFTYMKAFTGILNGERAFGGPIRADLGLTNRCNIRCIHCFFYSPFLERPSMQQLRLAKSMGDEIPDRESLERLQKIDIDMNRLLVIVDELFRMGTRRYQITGNGEPLLHPQALDLLAVLKQKGGRCVVKTNGICIDQSTADEVIKIGVDELKITTMAGTAETYTKTHPGASDSVFDNLKNILLYIAEKKAVHKVRYPEITLSCIIVKHNIDGLLEFARFANQVKANMVHYKPVDSVGDLRLAEVVPTTEQAASLHEHMKEVKAYLQSVGIPYMIERSAQHYCGQFDTSQLYQRIPCYFGWMGTRIFPEGKVYPCCRCNKPLGDVYKANFKEIWNGQTYRRFRREARALPVRQSQVTGCDCYDCIHYKANVRMHRMLHPYKRHSLREDKIDSLVLRNQ